VVREPPLKIAWVCDDCRTVFIFPDDVELHKKRSLHDSFSTYDMDTGRLLTKEGSEQEISRLSERTREELK
jgi:hypothetical protein